MSKFLSPSQFAAPVAESISQSTNSGSFTAQLQKTIQHCPPEAGIGMVIIRIDNFNDLKEQYGAEISQRLSTDIRERLQFRLRNSDILVSHASEFSIIINDLKENSALTQVKRKLLSALDSPFELAGHELLVRASAGSANYPQQGQDAYTLEIQARQVLS